MTRSPLLCAVAFLALCSSGCSKKADAATNQNGIPPEQVADLVHTIIEVDRATYAEQVVNRLQNQEKVIKASEHYKEDKALPLPSQMMRMGAQAATAKGKLRYALISEWAINKANMPKGDFESKGLTTIAQSAEKPYTTYETVNGKRYFRALYADKAVSEACVSCHNTHEQSPKHDFKVGDVMGAVTISIPLD
jgi:hypothetical protein